MDRLTAVTRPRSLWNGMGKNIFLEKRGKNMSYYDDQFKNENPVGQHPNAESDLEEPLFLNKVEDAASVETVNACCPTLSRETRVKWFSICGGTGFLLSFTSFFW